MPPLSKSATPRGLERPSGILAGDAQRPLLIEAAERMLKWRFEPIRRHDSRLLASRNHR